MFEFCGVGLGGGFVSYGIIDDTVILSLVAFISHNILCETISLIFTNLTETTATKTSHHTAAKNDCETKR